MYVGSKEYYLFDMRIITKSRGESNNWIIGLNYSMNGEKKILCCYFLFKLLFVKYFYAIF